MRVCLLLIPIIFLARCGSAIKVSERASESNKDVLILSVMIQEQLRKAYDDNFNFDQLMQIDTLKRISNNFEAIEKRSKWGHISIYYKFNESRDVTKVELTQDEVKRVKSYRWKVRQSKSQYDGEIQFDYGERFYRIVKIITSDSKN